jgi:hypothetical protein
MKPLFRNRQPVFNLPLFRITISVQGSANELTRIVTMAAEDRRIVHSLMGPGSKQIEIM